jgi:hypothetical protein
MTTDDRGRRPAKGDVVCYRSFAGDTWDAVVTNVRDDGLVDIDVSIPGCEDGFALHAIRFAERPERYTCAWPKEASDAEESHRL